jgi:hypothetical protein
MMSRRERRTALRVVPLEDRSVPAALVPGLTEDYFELAIDRAVERLSEVPIADLAWLDQPPALPPQLQALAAERLGMGVNQPPTTALDDTVIGALGALVTDLGFDPSQTTFADLDTVEFSTVGTLPTPFGATNLPPNFDAAKWDAFEPTDGALGRMAANLFLLGDRSDLKLMDGMMGDMGGMSGMPRILPMLPDFGGWLEIAALANAAQAADNTIGSGPILDTANPSSRNEGQPLNLDALTAFLTNTNPTTSLFTSTSTAEEAAVELNLHLGLAALTNFGLPAGTDLLATPHTELRPTADSGYGVITVLSTETTTPRTSAHERTALPFTVVSTSPLDEFLQGTAAVRLTELHGIQVVSDLPGGWLPFPAAVANGIEVAAAGAPEAGPAVIAAAPAVEKPVDAVEASSAGTLAVLFGVGMMQALHQQQRQRKADAAKPLVRG